MTRAQSDIGSMYRSLAFVLGILCLVSVVKADEVIFKNGDRITGKIDVYDGTKLTMKSGPAAKIDIDLKTVKTFSTDGPINVVLKNGTVIRRRVVLGPDGNVSYPAESAPPTTAPAATMPVIPREPIVSVFPFDQIKFINPPPVKWTGSVLLGGSLTEGNSETQSLNAAAHLGRRTEKSRITLDASYLYGRQKVPGDGSHETQNNWTVEGKYDYFFTPKFYSYVNVRVERDVIAGVDLRLTPGVGGGYQWIDTPKLKFNTEGGVSYLYRSYVNDGTSDSVSLRLAYHFTAKLADKVTFVQNTEYFPGLDSLSNYLITSNAGIRTDITSKLFAEFKMECRYDSQPAAGKKYLDLRYIVGVGFAF
jgi:putative salt-induced outer membrane protein YdiY